jgi:hypothetical protein
MAWKSLQLLFPMRNPNFLKRNSEGLFARLNPPEQMPSRGEFRREYAGEELIVLRPRKTEAHRCETGKNEYFAKPTEHSGIHLPSDQTRQLWPSTLEDVSGAIGSAPHIVWLTCGVAPAPLDRAIRCGK